MPKWLLLLLACPAARAGPVRFSLSLGGGLDYSLVGLQLGVHQGHFGAFVSGGLGVAGGV